MNSKHNPLSPPAGLTALLLAPLAALHAAEATYPSDAVMPLDGLAGEQTTDR
jgi:hypothetical protein